MTMSTTVHNVERVVQVVKRTIEDTNYLSITVADEDGCVHEITYFLNDSDELNRFAMDILVGVAQKSEV